MMMKLKMIRTTIKRSAGLPAIFIKHTLVMFLLHRNSDMF